MIDLAIPGGATAAEYIQKKWGVPTQGLPRQDYNLGAGVTRVLKNNPRRMEAIVYNLGVGNVYLDYAATVSTVTGFLLPPLGGSVILTIDEDGELVTYDWYAVDVFQTGVVRVFEVQRV